MNPLIQTVLSALQKSLRGLYGDRLVQLVHYGSTARGDAEPGSDIDLLVVLKGPVDAGLEIERTGEVVSTLSLRHDVVIACIFMDQERFFHRHSPFLRNVRQDGITL
jgi:predicted nucleotidyltransferase